jgi:putative glutamine amidotransferase
MNIIGCTGESKFQSDIISMIEEAFGANPLKLCQNNTSNLDYWLAQCRGVVLAGGVDIHPRIYGGSVLNNSGFTKFDFLRDVREAYVIKYCLAHHIPLFGICRGHQMLGAYFGLAFCPHLDGKVCHNPNKQGIDITENEPMHSVHLTDAADESYEVKDCYSMFGRDSSRRKLWVNSFHHQGLINESVPSSVIVLGTADALENSTIVEMMCGGNWLSVQWHPEFDWRQNDASKMVLQKFQQLLND